jgi:glycosyltransferase involved in cell wall biosynthesis
MANILALVTFKIFPPKMGGQKGVALFYKHLAQSHTIVIATTTDNENVTTGISIKKILYRNKWIILKLLQVFRLKKIIQKHKIDVIISEHSYPAFLGLILKKLTGKPFIIHSHNIEAFRFKQLNKWWWKLYWKYEKKVHQLTDYNFFISEQDNSAAVLQFNIHDKKCMVVPYGVETTFHTDAGKQLRTELGLLDDVLLFYFNGTLNYKPNSDAIKVLLDLIDPILNKLYSNYRIIITGEGLEEIAEKRIVQNSNFIYKGYVNDVSLYYQGSNVFLNPVLNSSGVKTKVIEAISHGLNVVSTFSGASGIPAGLCGSKLIITPDNDWQQFAQQAISHASRKYITSKNFNDYFYWPNIISRASNIIDEISKEK